MTKSLTIFYPSRNVGGVQLALIRIPDWRIVVVDYEDGFLRRNLAALGFEAEFILWHSGLAPVNVGDTTLLLSFSHFPHDLAALRAAPTTRVLLWSMHAQGTLSYFRFGFFIAAYYHHSGQWRLDFLSLLHGDV